MDTSIAARWHVVRDYHIGTAINTASKNKSIVRGLQYHRRVYGVLRSWQKISAPEMKLEVEPWFRKIDNGKSQMCQPDAVLIDPISNTGLVIEVKLNWKDGRDEKLIGLYLDAATEAFGLDATWPALITSNVRGYRGEPRLGLGHLLSCYDWQPGQITPLVLLP